ncbi:MAG: 50S ribosomal protein L28 [Candidatus Pacebacteria bacterium]|nr:50S ribosomal protein L28 [Candidatus Paceibacterota bacterium]
MARSCVITGKNSKVGGGYSNRTRATQFNPVGKRRRKANLHKKKIYVPELKKYVTVTISTKGLKTINKNGPYKALKKAGVVK